MGGITPLPQNASEATYCKKIEKEDGLIDWSKSAEDIYHMWQAYTPWPGIYTIYEGKRLLLEKVSYSPPVKGGGREATGGFLDSSFIPRNDAVVGQVIKCNDGSIGIICGE